MEGQQFDYWVAFPPTQHTCSFHCEDLRTSIAQKVPLFACPGVYTFLSCKLMGLGALSELQGGSQLCDLDIRKP